MSAEKTGRVLRWNVLALAFAGPALLAVIVWIIHLLQPAKWCGALIGAAKEARIPAPECSTIILRLLDVHRETIWLLGGTLGIVIVAIGLAASGMAFKGKAFGAEADFSSSDSKEQEP